MAMRKYLSKQISNNKNKFAQNTITEIWHKIYSGSPPLGTPLPKPPSLGFLTWFPQLRGNHFTNGGN